MGPSDFIGLLGLVLAAFAIIPWTERKFYLLFFTKMELRLAVIFICFIQVFMSFDWIQRHWWPALQRFTIKAGIPATTWAYILAVSVVIYPVAIIIRGRFPVKNKRKLISLYKKMVAGNEIPQLVQYLEIHHKKDIIYFLQQQSETTQLPNNLKIAREVFDKIINDEKFVEYNAQSFPHFLSHIIVSLKKVDPHNKKLISQYSKHLCTWGNAEFLTELEDLPDADWTNLNTIFSNGRFPIFKSLIKPANRKFRKEAAFTIGNMGVNSLQKTTTRQFLQKKSPEDMNENMNEADYEEMILSECRGQSIWTAIVFYRYLIQAVIIEADPDDTLFVGYYLKYVQELMAMEPVTLSSNSFLLIETIISNLVSWLKLFNEERIKQQPKRLQTILVILGKIIEEVATWKPDAKINLAKFQKDQIKKIIQYHLDVQQRNNCPASKIMEAETRRLLQSPSFTGADKLPTYEYIDLFSQAWDEWKQEETITPGQQAYVEEKILPQLNIHT